MTLLAVDDLCSGYGALQVLFGVSLTVEEGEVVALMGSNGAGKTTTLRTIVGMIPTTAGQVLLDDRPVRGAPPERLVELGVVMVPEGRGMLRDLTVAENLSLGAYVVRDKRQVAEAMDKVLTTFPILHERREQKAGTLSGGQQQMLALGRALMASPRLMLVDEASMGLSPVMTERAFALIADINRTSGVAVLIVEQNVLALDLADRAYVLEKGQVVASAEGAGVRQMQSQLREAYLGTSA
ncbi:MAG: amino acid/amide transporter ATP-binding protein 2, family [Frankiales bacterium]|jgi:branched-chain amino acid transport system ATP-binding protein|nr:amino acid/amide transporter ATP-binding protein 2, family [Frankiales bacterium]